ncbi:2Fe-2S iron-sulfur cluster-binding protein [Streptomyces sp. FXY-T5]|uniref:2Fe-2S iron-sulfur cluster-binding protein n=1 Tax=Streptomyces sp. FXY-T5 TaxID=3064901 RepID=UPI0027D2074F|nr:2Fe-2S iron-sulfur cluster-binding protein [Streptomyces sp. FXY-T5]WMD09054.1 2Fe-2S iron-sulfur cluster-binding protein [Streptomyces sp. FXY-T5]
MSDDQHGEGTPRGGSRWDPLPQGEYDDGATAFVELPEGGVDALLAADSPLAAPGHGYVPPQITVNPATTAGTDPSATGAWPVPGAPVDGAQWHDPNAGHQQYDHEHGAHHQQGHDVPEQPYGGTDAPYGPGAPYGPDATARPHGGDDRFTYNPGTTGQWNFEETAAAAGGAPGHDVTGQWSIPVAGGDLPDESGEFTTSSLVEQWGGTPPATLPGGAAAPWATQATGRPWGQDPQDTAGHGQGDAAPASGYAQGSGYAPEQQAAGPLPQEAGPEAGPGHHPQDVHGPGVHEDTGHGHAHQSGEFGHGPEAPGDGHAVDPSRFADPGAEPSDVAEHRPEHQELAEHEPEHRDFAEHVPDASGTAGHAPGQPYSEAPDGFSGAPGPGAHPEPAALAQDAQEASQAAPGLGETGAPSEFPEDAPAAPEAADSPSEPASGPLPDGPASGPLPDADAGTDPETADGETPADDQVPAEDQIPAEDPAPAATAPSAAAPHDVPPAAPQEEHPLASYVLRVNGTDRPVGDAWIGESLLYVLRERLGLAGAKDGCSQGECGACNVQVDGRLVASCLVPAVTAAGSEVRTVEGLAEDGQPSDVQRALARCGAVQCGFCVPGMAMTLHDLLEGNPAPTELETRQALCGNLCRCSGYRGVVDAVQEVVAEREAHSAPADGDSDEPRIPHQAGPGAGGVNASAFGAPPQPHTPEPHSPEAHDQPYGQDGGPA